MGACCSRDDAGTCAICQYPCATRACKCSYLHRECAQSFKRTRCTICNSFYRSSFWLARAPPVSRNDQNTLLQWDTRRKVAERRHRYTLRVWLRDVFPLLRSFCFRYNLKIRTCEAALLLLQDCEHTDAFLQHMMDMGRSDGVYILQQFHLLWTTYDDLSPSTLRMINTVFHSHQTCSQSRMLNRGIHPDLYPSHRPSVTHMFA